MLDNQRQGGNNREGSSREATLERSQISAPAISLPKGGGAIRGVHVNTAERMWTTVRNFLRPFRGVHKQSLSSYVAMCEFSINLNTHTPAALYEAFEPAEAKRILDRLECHYTPKHGSWLNMVESEIGVLSEQCLDDRIHDEETLRRQITVWEASRNQQQATVNWRFSS